MQATTEHIKKEDRLCMNSPLQLAQYKQGVFFKFNTLFLMLTFKIIMNTPIQSQREGKHEKTFEVS